MLLIYRLNPTPHRFAHPLSGLIHQHHLFLRCQGFLRRRLPVWRIECKLLRLWFHRYPDGCFNSRYPLKSYVPHPKKRLKPMKDGSRLYLRNGKLNRRHPLKSCVPHLKKRLKLMKDGSRLFLRKGKATISSRDLPQGRRRIASPPD